MYERYHDIACMTWVVMVTTKIKSMWSFVAVRVITGNDIGYNKCIYSLHDVNVGWWHLSQARSN